MNKIKKVSAAAPSKIFHPISSFVTEGVAKRFSLSSNFKLQTSSSCQFQVTIEGKNKNKEVSGMRREEHTGEEETDRKRRTDHLRRDDNDGGGCFMSVVFICLCFFFQFPDEKELRCRNKLYIRYKRSFSFCLLTDCLLDASAKKSTRVTTRITKWGNNSILFPSKCLGVCWRKVGSVGRGDEKCQVNNRVLFWQKLWYKIKFSVENEETGKRE